MIAYIDEIDYTFVWQAISLDDSDGGIRLASFAGVHSGSRSALQAGFHAVLYRIFRCVSWALLYMLL